jgi:hypothetical protein
LFFINFALFSFSLRPYPPAETGAGVLGEALGAPLLARPSKCGAAEFCGIILRTPERREANFAPVSKSGQGLTLRRPTTHEPRDQRL